MITVPQMKDDDPEVRKETRAYTTTTKDDVLDSLIEHYSIWWKLLRAYSVVDTIQELPKKQVHKRWAFECM